MTRALVALALSGLCLAGGLWYSLEAGATNGGGDAGLGVSIDFSFHAELNLQSDVCGHDPYIWGLDDPAPHTIKLQAYQETGHSLNIGGPGAWIDVTGDPGLGGEITAYGVGDVAGFEDIPVKFEGFVHGAQQTIEGKYTFGVAGVANPGHLPPCDDDGIPGTPPEAYPAVYEVKAKPATATPTPSFTITPEECSIAGGSDSCTPTATPSGPQETVEQFLQLFNTALQTGDESFLLARLNPHVIETYGEENCAATVAAMVDPTSSFTIKSISGPAPWTWSPPGVSVLVDDVYTVSLLRVVDGEPSVQDIHLAVVEGHLTWFRTCPPAGTPVATTTPDNCLIAGGSSCTPTNTPAPPTMAATDTATPPVVPPTWTPTPRRGDGDCDDNGTTNAVDALYVLQYTAGLIPSPGACGDTNLDEILNAIDCSLILQYSAGLIDSLPWNP